jgi:GntR family transcriptional regulator
MNSPISTKLPAIKLDADQRLPLYERLKAAIRAGVRDGVWPAGSSIPAEGQLAQDTGLAVGTVRRALQDLVDEGMLERRQGRGTFVRRPDFGTSLFRFFRLQSIDRRELVPEGRILDRNLVDAPEMVAERLRLAKGAQAIRITRLRLAEGEPLLLEEIYLAYPDFAPVLEVELDQLGPLLYPVYERLCGKVVASAEEELVIGVADESHAAMLDVAPGAPVAVVERLAKGRDGTPLEWRRSIGRGDRFRYRTEIR